jgi:hypothetical protein
MDSEKQMNEREKIEYAKEALARKIPTHGIKLNLVIAEFTGKHPVDVEAAYLEAHRAVQKAFAEG